VPNESWHLSWLVLLLGICALPDTSGKGMAQTGPTPVLPPAQSSRQQCGDILNSRPLTYRNPRFGFTMTYPPGFVLDPDSIPENGDSARFWTADRQATAVITGLHNGLHQSIADLMREAKADVIEHSHGTITYTRQRDNWFVISGYLGTERIFYQRSVLAHEGSAIGILWIEFPRAMKPCFEAAVTMMSLSFRGPGPNALAHQRQ
jgi:hypothetical protein